MTSTELQAIAVKHDTSIAQVVISWVIQEGAVAIPRGSSEGHVRENAQSWTMDESGRPLGVQVILDNDDMKAIRALDGSLGPLWD